MTSTHRQQSKLKVLVDLHDLRVASTGIKTYIRELLKVLDHIGEEKIEVIKSPNIEQVGNGFFRENSKWRSMIFHVFTVCWKQMVIPFKVWRHKVDVLICPDFYAPMWKMRARKVVVFHDAFFWDNRGHYNALWGLYFRNAVIWGLRGRSVALTVSETSKKNLRGIVPSHIPVKVARTSIDFSAIADGYSAQSLTPYFLHVGVFERRKNLTMLISSFRKVKDQLGESRPVQLVLIGHQHPRPTLSDYEAITQAVEDEGLQDSVSCPGHLTQEEVWAYYKGALGYVLPSLSEGFGLPLLEAFHAGIPVVMSDIPVLREIAGQAALTADPHQPEDWASKMLDIYFDHGLREALVRRGKARLEEFTLTNFATQLEKVLFV